jgi:hypothetical protein
MRQAYVQKKLYCRHLCKTFASLRTWTLLFIPTDIIKNQIATGKGFFAYAPVINDSSWDKYHKNRHFLSLYIVEHGKIGFLLEKQKKIVAGVNACHY